jgi:hypothetical protein
LIQTRYRAGDRPAIIRIKFHDHPDGKPGQLSEALGRTQNLQSFDDAPIQLDQIVFGQLGDRATAGSRYPLRLPVFQSKSRNSRKLARIVRHQRQIVSKGNGSDL